MTPVFQTRYGIGRGNCLTACVASVLDLPIDALPEFCDAEGGGWFDRLYDYCRRNGLFLIYWNHSEDVPMIAVEAYLIMELKLEGVESEHHSVVGRCYRTSTYLQPDGSKRWEWATEVVHDPNEHGRPDTESVLSYILIGKRGVELNA